MWNNIGESGHPCLVPDLEALSVILDVDLSHYGLYKVEICFHSNFQHINEVEIFYFYVFEFVLYLHNLLGNKNEYYLKNSS